MNTVTELGAEHVVDEPVLGDPRHTCKRGRAHDRVEVMAVAGDAGDGARDAGLDPGLQFLWGCGHFR